MKNRMLDLEHASSWVLVFDKGDEFISTMQEFADDHDLDAAAFMAIGAFSDVVLQYFDPELMDYRKTIIAEQCEVLILSGNIAIDGDERKIHAHGVIGMSDTSTRGGHIGSAHVWPTLEVVIEKSPAHLQRRVDRQTGLALIDLPGGS